jgi:glutathione S-transferase
MITVHHLNNSRSQRILWLLEELGQPYDVIKYERNSETRLAPEALKTIHPLGKAPVIEDDGRILAESGAIMEYILRKYGKGRLSPPEASQAYFDHLYWMHFAEGSAMLPLLLALYVGRLGDASAPLQPRITGETASMLGHMEGGVKGKDYFLGRELDACDIQLSFVVEAADARDLLVNYPNLKGFIERCRARPAYKRSIDKGGPFSLRRPAPAQTQPAAAPR